MFFSCKKIYDASQFNNRDVYRCFLCPGSMSGLILAVGWPLRIRTNNLCHSCQSKLPPLHCKCCTSSWDYHVHKLMKNFQIQWLLNYFIKIAQVLFLLQLRWETRWRDLSSNLSLNDSNSLFLQMNTWRVTNAPAVKFLWRPRRQTKKWTIHNEECRGLDEMPRKCLRYLSPCSSVGNRVERIRSCGLVEGGMLLRMDSEVTKASTLQCVLSTSGFWAHSYHSRHLLPATSTPHSHLHRGL